MNAAKQQLETLLTKHKEAGRGEVGMINFEDAVRLAATFILAKPHYLRSEYFEDLPFTNMFQLMSAENPDYREFFNLAAQSVIRLATPEINTEFDACEAINPNEDENDDELNRRLFDRNEIAAQRLMTEKM